MLCSVILCCVIFLYTFQTLSWSRFHCVLFVFCMKQSNKAVLCSSHSASVFFLFLVFFLFAFLVMIVKHSRYRFGIIVLFHSQSSQLILQIAKYHITCGGFIHSPFLFNIPAMCVMDIRSV